MKLPHLDLSCSVEKITGKWEPLIDGDYISGLKCFEVEKSTMTVNKVGGFSRKQDAIKWIENCFPISSADKTRGVYRFIWARNWKQAEQLTEMELAEVIEFNDQALIKAYLFGIPRTEIDNQSLRAGLKVKISGSKLEKVLFTANEISTTINMGA